MDIFDLIVRTPGTCGGEARLAGHRITMELLEDLVRQGLSDKQIHELYPHLDFGNLEQALKAWFTFKNYWSGICLCGHSWERHHISMVAQQKYVDLTNEGSLPGECLAFGHNETGGLDRDGNVHCMGFVDKDRPDLNRRGLKH